MTNVTHIATIAAYPVKDELGGGYRGVMLVRETKARTASDRFDTLEEAKSWAKTKAWEAFNGCTFAALRKRGEYQANVWVEV